MKLSVYPNTPLSRIPEDSTEIYMVRPLKQKFFEKLLKKCSLLDTISLSKSTSDRLSGKVKKYLKQNKVLLKIEKARGRAIEIDGEKMLQVIEMRKDNRPLREIEKITGIPKSTIHYLVKYSDRKKMKHGKDVIHLK